MNQLELLDAAKEVTGSDYETANRIGASRQRLSNARTLGKKLDLWAIGAIAEIAGINPKEAIFKIAAEREGQTKKGRDWRRWAGAAAIALMLSPICAISLPSTTYAHEGGGFVYYVKCRKWRRRRYRGTRFLMAI